MDLNRHEFELDELIKLKREETGDPERIATIRGPGGCKPRHRPPAAALRGPRLSCLLYTSPSPRDATLSRVAGWG